MKKYDFCFRLGKQYSHYEGAPTKLQLIDEIYQHVSSYEEENLPSQTTMLLKGYYSNKLLKNIFRRLGCEFLTRAETSVTFRLPK